MIPPNKTEKGAFTQMFHLRPCAFLLALAVMICTGTARATTLMVMADWYMLGSVDTLIRPDSVWVPRYDSASRSGYYLGRKNLQLVRSDAFARTIPVNSAVPEWYSLPGFARSDFNRELLRFEFKYLSGVHHAFLGTDQTVHVQLDSAYQSGTTAQLNDPFAVRKILLDRCIDSLGPVDTLWLRDRSPITSFAAKMDCFNHNPFWEERGTILFRPPFPVVDPFVEVDGLRFRMRPSVKFHGWYTAPRLDSATSSAKTVKLRFDARGNNGSRVAWDSQGSPWSVALDSGDTVFMQPEGLSPNQHPNASKPAVWIGFPAGDRLAFGPDWNGLVGKPALSGWAGLPLWERPESIWLTHPDGSRSNRISIPVTGDSIWILGDAISTHPVAPGLEKVFITAHAFDYDSSYTPFAEKGPDDNCLSTTQGGWATKGLVKDSLDADGLPIWTGKIACDIGVAADGPGNWFKPGRARSEATIRVVLANSGKQGEWSYSNTNFFPLDTVTSIVPRILPNYGFCLHYQFEAENVPGASITVSGDDDIWLFAQKRLALDLGGQHAPDTARLEFWKLGLAQGRTIKLDLFQCERHRVGSSFGISTNALLHPVGTLKEPLEPTSKIVEGSDGSAGLGMFGHKLHVVAPQAGAWSVEIRSLDGRRLFAKAGTGSADLDLGGLRGAVVAGYVAGGVRQTRTLMIR
jgi:fibro-slime domain-containing protein